MLQQRPAGAVDDAFRNAGRAGGIEDVERVVEGQVVEDGRLGLAGEEIVPAHGVGDAGDIPIVGDWDGNGTSDLGVIRGNLWIIDSDGDRKLTANDLRVEIPKPTADAEPIIGDWDGDGDDEFGYYHAAG